MASKVNPYEKNVLRPVLTKEEQDTWREGTDETALRAIVLRILDKDYGERHGI